MTTFDANANLAFSLVTVAPVPAASGTSLTVADASSFPADPFYALVWPPDVCAYLSNAELVRVTGVAGNVFTIDRAEGGTSAQAIAAGWQIANTLTAEIIDAIEAAILALEAAAGDYVILDPLTSVRNRINPAADVIPLSVFGSVGQTADLFDVGVEPDVAFFRLVALEALGLGAGTFDPAAYGGGYYDTRFVVSNAQDGFYESNGGPPIRPVPGTAATQVFFDLEFVPTADNAEESFGLGGSIRLTGANDADAFTGLYYEALMHGTKATGTGVQSSSVQGANFTAGTYIGSGSTGDLDQVIGLSGGAVIGTNNLFVAGGELIGVYGIAGETLGSGSSIPKAEAFKTLLFSNGRTITEASGLNITAPTGVASFGTVYGVKIDSQTGAATKSFGIFSAGGFNELRAGAATEIPLTLRGFAAQSANLFVTEDSAGADLVAITAAGRIVFGSAADTNLYRSAADVLKTDDSFLVGATLEQDGTQLGLLGAAPVVQQAASSLSDLWTSLKNYGLLTSGSDVNPVAAPDRLFLTRYVCKR